MKKAFWFLLAFVMFVAVACGSSMGNSSTTDTTLEDARKCLKIDLYKCSDRARGTITNNCTYDFSAVKIIVTGYSEKGGGGSKVDGDEEYVEGLFTGEDKDFEAVFSMESDGKIKSCQAKVEEVYLK